MASKKKKRKLSKAELKKIRSEKGKLSVEKQGKGAGLRKSFTLPAKWREEHAEKSGKMQLKFVSPGKTEYKTEKSVAHTLTARNLDACFNASSASSEETEDSEDVEYLPYTADSDELNEPGCSEREGKKKDEQGGEYLPFASKRKNSQVGHRAPVVCL